MRNKNEHADISSRKVNRDLYASEKQRPGIPNFRRSLPQIIIPNSRNKRDDDHNNMLLNIVKKAAMDIVEHVSLLYIGASFGYVQEWYTWNLRWMPSTT